jgi:hypothetical protein
MPENASGDIEHARYDAVADWYEQRFFVTVTSMTSGRAHRSSRLMGPALEFRCEQARLDS